MRVINFFFFVHSRHLILEDAGIFDRKTSCVSLPPMDLRLNLVENGQTDRPEVPNLDYLWLSLSLFVTAVRIYLSSFCRGKISLPGSG